MLLSDEVFVICSDVLCVCFVIFCPCVEFVFHVMCYPEIVPIFHYLYLIHRFCVDLLSFCNDIVLCVV